VSGGLRLFVAAEPPEALRDELAALGAARARARRRQPGGSPPSRCT
jgi:hypothetical protein